MQIFLSGDKGTIELVLQGWSIPGGCLRSQMVLGLRSSGTLPDYLKLRQEFLKRVRVQNFELLLLRYLYPG